jgi:hypothetical protein
MKILVNGEVKELEIVDPKSGCNWEQDLLGNADALGYDDETELPTMDEDDFNWWADYIDKEQDLQNRAKAVRDELDNDDQESFDFDMIDASGSDYETTQMNQISVVEKWEPHIKMTSGEPVR